MAATLPVTFFRHDTTHTLVLFLSVVVYTPRVQIKVSCWLMQPWISKYPWWEPSCNCVPLLCVCFLLSVPAMAGCVWCPRYAGENIFNAYSQPNYIVYTIIHFVLYWTVFVWSSCLWEESLFGPHQCGICVYVWCHKWWVGFPFFQVHLHSFVTLSFACVLSHRYTLLIAPFCCAALKVSAGSSPGHRLHVVCLSTYGLSQSWLGWILI